MTWFGGKRRVAAEVWSRFGDVNNYVEPFFGSGAVLLGRPSPRDTETVNDKDSLLANFWRALQVDPEAVAAHADWPVNEVDLHARHINLLNRIPHLSEKMIVDPKFYDIEMAGWWVWGVSSWIGSGWCSGNGPWNVVDGHLQKIKAAGVKRQLPNLTGAGNGVHRKVPYPIDYDGGIRRGSMRENLVTYMTLLAERMRRVRVCCGDWSRVVKDTVTIRHGTTAVFLDPPYSAVTGRYKEVYREDCGNVAHDVREWALAHGSNPSLRIAMCGYVEEHDSLCDAGWSIHRWVAGRGFSTNKNENRHREAIWFSPYCLNPPALELHDDEMPNGLRWEIQVAS